jgi:hypothetical protein
LLLALGRRDGPGAKITIHLDFWLTRHIVLIREYDLRAEACAAEVKAGGEVQ